MPQCPRIQRIYIVLDVGLQFENLVCILSTIWVEKALQMLILFVDNLPCMVDGEMITLVTWLGILPPKLIISGRNIINILMLTASTLMLLHCYLFLLLIKFKKEKNSWGFIVRTIYVRTQGSSQLNMKPKDWKTGVFGLKTKVLFGSYFRKSMPRADQQFLGTQGANQCWWLRWVPNWHFTLLGIGDMFQLIALSWSSN